MAEITSVVEATTAAGAMVVQVAPKRRGPTVVAAAGFAWTSLATGAMIAVTASPRLDVPSRGGEDCSHGFDSPGRPQPRGRSLGGRDLLPTRRPRLRSSAKLNLTTVSCYG